MTLHGRYFQIFVLNLPAPFTAQVFGAQLPHIDYLIGNEAEFEVWASANGLPDPKGLPAVTKALAQQPKSNLTRDRVVVFTHGAAIAVCSSSPDNVRTCAVNALKDEVIVDTGGVGDAFAGGLLGTLAIGKSLDGVIEADRTLGTTCVTRWLGLQYEWPKVNVLW